MLKSYEILRQMFQQTVDQQNLDDKFDEMPQPTQMCEEEILNYCVQYFTTETEAVEYPGKSYCVAIIYAAMLSKFFEVDAIEMLMWEDLIPGDPCFVPHDIKQFDMYKRILSVCPAAMDCIDKLIFPKLPQVIKTIECFKQEYMLGTKQFYEVTQGRQTVLNTPSQLAE